MNQNTLNITPAQSTAQLKAIEDLAREILPEFYDPVIPPDHTLFYIDKFCLVKALQQQMEEGCEHYLLDYAGTYAGYLTILIAGSVLFVSKLYLLARFRGNGIGDKAMLLVDNLASKNKISRIGLIVHQENPRGIQFYERRGFKITEPAVYTFENGHTIYNFKMEKIVPQ
jgi:diamine N-acetyltransferase